MLLMVIWFKQLTSPFLQVQHNTFFHRINRCGLRLLTTQSSYFKQNYAIQELHRKVQKYIFLSRYTKWEAQQFEVGIFSFVQDSLLIFLRFCVLEIVTLLYTYVHRSLDSMCVKSILYNRIIPRVQWLQQC